MGNSFPSLEGIGAAKAPGVILQSLSVGFPGVTLIEDLSRSIGPGETVMVVGDNGSGKSTLLQTIAGTHRSLSGAVHLVGRPVVVSQVMRQREGLSVKNVVDSAIERALSVESLIQERAERIAAGDDSARDEYDMLLRLAEAEQIWTARRRAFAAAQSLGAPTDPDRPLSKMSVGERYKLRLGSLLGGDPGILILDEPTNHLDSATTEALGELLSSYRGISIVASHSLELLTGSESTFLDLDPTEDGRVLVTSGTFEDAQRTRSRHNMRWRTRYTAKMQQFGRLEKELQELRSNEVDHWRPEKQYFNRTARVPHYAANRKRIADRIEEVIAQMVRPREPPQPFHIQPYSPNEDWSINLREVRVDARLDKDLTFRIDGTNRTALVGPNGSGKSTLLEVIAAQLSPTRGSITRDGEPYIRRLLQDLEFEDPDLLVTDLLERELFRAADARITRLNYFTEPIKSGLVTGAVMESRMGDLSVGQRRKLELAMVLCWAPDLILLDEPTNHLSVTSMNDLIKLLDSAPCAVVIATHEKGWIPKSWEIVDLDLTACNTKANH